jgi:hypothetical protein
MNLMLKNISVIYRVFIACIIAIIFLAPSLEPLYAQSFDNPIDAANNSEFTFVSRDATEQDIRDINVRNIAGTGGNPIEEGDSILVIEMRFEGQLIHTFYTQLTLGSRGFEALGLDSFGKITAPDLEDRTFTFRSGNDTTEIEVKSVNVARRFFELPANAGTDDRNVPGNTDPIPADDSTDADETDETPRCEESFDFPGAWIVCLVLTTISGTVDKMVDAIADMLSVGRAEINDDGLKIAWSYFRNIASVLLVVIGLVMIIGQAVSKE